MRAGRFGGSSRLQGRTATGGRWGGLRSPFGSQSGGGSVAAPVLTLVVDDLEQDPPVYLFDCDVACDGYWDFHSSATPPAVGAADIATGTFALIAGENSFDVDLTDYVGETGYLHFRGINGGGESNILTSQVITVALVDIQQIFYPPLGQATGTPSDNSLATIATGNYMAWIAEATEAMAITHVGFKTVAATGTPTATITIEGVDAAGLPDGVAAATVTTGTLSANSLSGPHALNATVNLVRGQSYAVKIAHASGTSFQPARFGWQPPAYNRSRPYQVTNTGTPTIAAITAQPHLALGSSATAFYELGWAWGGVSSYTANTFSTTTHRRGLYITLPRTMRCIGVRHSPGTQTGDFTIGIYTAAGAEVSSSSTAIDASLGGVATSSNNELIFDNPVTLTKDTPYRVVLTPTSGTIQVPYITVASTNYSPALPWGANAYYTAYDGSSWSETTTQLPLLQLIIDQI